LCVGYLLYKLFRRNDWNRLPVNRSWNSGWDWSLSAGLIGTFMASFAIEVIDSPKQNGVPFFKAWHQFADDKAGGAVFVTLYVIVCRGLFAKPNPSLQRTIPAVQ
jgi:hypothetical protein